MIETLLLCATATVSVALAAGPLSLTARNYVENLRSQAAAPMELSTNPADITPAAPPTIKFPSLLQRIPQGFLACFMVGLTLAWGLITKATADTLIALPLVAILCVACSVDAVCHRLPNKLLLWAAYWVGGVTLLRLFWDLATGVSLGEAGWPVTRALLSAIIAFVALLVLAALPSGLGMGDVKLWGVLGLWLGRFSAWAPVTGLMMGFFVGGVAAILLIVLRRVGRKDSIAFGPYLAVGAWLTWLVAIL